MREQARRAETRERASAADRTTRPRRSAHSRPDLRHGSVIVSLSSTPDGSSAAGCGRRFCLSLGRRCLPWVQGSTMSKSGWVQTCLASGTNPMFQDYARHTYDVSEQRKNMHFP